MSREEPSEVGCTVRTVHVLHVLVSTLTVRVPVYMQIKPISNRDNSNNTSDVARRLSVTTSTRSRNNYHQ